VRAAAAAEARMDTDLRQNLEFCGRSLGEPGQENTAEVLH